MYTKPIRIHRDWGQPGSERKQASRCSESGCSRATRHKKPFCDRHLSNLPYVEQLQAQMEEAEQHNADVLRRGANAVRADSIVAMEILSYVLTHGPKTNPRLARELNYQVALVQIVTAALRKMHLVYFVKNARRNQDVVHITSKGEEHINPTKNNGR